MKYTDKHNYQEHYEAVNNHICKFFNNEKTNIIHELTTIDIHLDIYHIKPQNSEFDILLTSGMSSVAMNVADISTDSASHRFAELISIIPKGIGFGKFYPSNTKNDWIISMLKQTAKFPHFADTWIGIGHTLQANEDMTPYSKDTVFSGCMILPTVSLPKDFQIIETQNGIINIFGIFPLYKEELEYKIKNGFEKFMKLLIKYDANEMIDPNRINYCK